MTRRHLRLAFTGGLAALALGLSACGDSDDDKDKDDRPAAASTSGTPAAPPADGRRGGVLTQLGADDVDTLDPGATYTGAGWQVAYSTHRTLYSNKPGEDIPRPDLAASEPQISPDKKTITVKLRSDVKFGPPVNRTITSKDVKYAFERAFSKNVGNLYTFYFSAIEGAPDKPTDGVKPISGIQTPDDKTVVFKLEEAVPSLAAALVMPITAPVPEEFAERFDAKSPSTYAERVVPSGPYMVSSDEQGKLTGYVPGKSIELVRNPGWEASTDYRPAYLDAIRITTNESNMSVATRQILKGSRLSIDTNPPAAELKLAVTKYEGQFQQLPSGSFRWFPLNTKIKPLDDINVRKAIIAGFDRTAAIKARGGEFTGTPGTHFIPPGVPGFAQAGGTMGGGQDYLADPRGDLDVAAAYMKKAGFPSGRYTGDEELLMVSPNEDPGRSQSLVAKAQFEKLGFKVRLRQVPQDAAYAEYCQVPARKVAICGAASWFKDFNDPQTMLEPVFKGSNITDAGNNNVAQLDVPAIDKAMDAAALLTGEARYKAWGAVDKLIVDQAPGVPFVWDKTTIVWSKDVLGVVNGHYLALDYAFTSLK